MRQWKLIAILALSAASGALSGCSPREVYLGPGQIAELRDPVKVQVWIRNKETGKKEWRLLRAKAGWFIGRPRPGSADDP